MQLPSSKLPLAPAIGILAAALLLPAARASEPNLIANGDFESGLEGWNSFWSRDTGAGTATLDSEAAHSGKSSARISHTGGHDWSFNPKDYHKVQPGGIYELSGWLKGKGEAALSVVTRKADDSVVAWTHGDSTLSATGDWAPIRARFLIPPDIHSMLPRVTGHGPAEVWIDALALRRMGSLDEMRAPDLPVEVSTANESLKVTLRTRDAALSVTHLPTKHEWSQLAAAGCLVLSAQAVDAGIDFTVLDAVSMRKLDCALRLQPGQPEALLTIASPNDEPMDAPLSFPSAFSSAVGEYAILPVNEGISYPVDDESISPASHHLYGGHGLCMAWYGSTGGKLGWMAIVETPDDAAVRMDRHDGLFCLAPQWVPQKGRFGEPRRIRYRFFDDGGYVAMAKRYRQFARETGNFKTLEEKRKANPNVDLLIGAVNVWCWDRDPVSLCEELQAAGIERILWSCRQEPETLVRLNALGNILTSRYDIYQDSMNPEYFPKLRGAHSDWTSEAWERGDIMIDASGDWVRGWKVKAKDDSMIPCGVLCDRQAVAYAKERIPAELKDHPYRSRFIDTTTASPWRECYDPRHPMTRTDSKRAKMELLQFVSEGCGLVCGCETGHDAAVPYLHYFEGMLSLGPYRVPDSGRNMMETWDEAPERVAKFQTGHRYRLPLWELVYHDCVVAQWYWGDYNNKLPVLWDRRDLWNALYGTPPMFMFDRGRWSELKDRFAQSYRTAAPVARATGYSEMLSHQWLTPNHSVQRTRFANGVEVTVNFGDKPWSLEDGSSLAAMSHRVTGIE